MTLEEIAELLRQSTKKTQLIYAFNGTGKTRLCGEFKKLITASQDIDGTNDEPEQALTRKKILYYNAFTEDLFYWDNDLETNAEPKLKIQPNTFTDWILKDQGQDMNVISTFQRYANNKLTPRFNAEYSFKDSKDTDVKVKAFSEITFSLEGGDERLAENIKISKGEESNLIWSLFYTLLSQVVETLNITELDERDTDQFDNLEYVFVDDPVSSLDDNHLIELAIDLAQMIKSSKSNLKFIITTHNPLFYNVLHNELRTRSADKFVLRKLEDGTYNLVNQYNDSPFSYHLSLKDELVKAAESGAIQRYHFNFLRNVLEKTSTFLGYSSWGDLLPDTQNNQGNGTTNPYARVINLYNHAQHSGDEISEVSEDHKRVFRFLVNEISNIYKGTRLQQQMQSKDMT